MGSFDVKKFLGFFFFVNDLLIRKNNSLKKNFLKGISEH